MLNVIQQIIQTKFDINDVLCCLTQRLVRNCNWGSKTDGSWWLL